MKLILIQGGGDLASGVAYRLVQCGFPVLITELQAPLAVRRKVSFAQAMYDGQVMIEGIVGKRIEDYHAIDMIMETISDGNIPVVNDSNGKALDSLKPIVLIDARMSKRHKGIFPDARLVIGLGPGFFAGENCHVAIETKRGHMLGRVIRNGGPEQDTGIPDRVLQYHEERVLRAPAEGTLVPFAGIGDHLEPNQMIAEIGGNPILAPFSGVLRGIVHPNVLICKGMKIGDIDPRDEPLYCHLISEKALAISGGVLEAILSHPDIRTDLLACPS
jgi:xanthine dehydrogenase accessory factor